MTKCRRQVPAGSPSTSPLVDLVREHEADFAAAVASRDMARAAGTVLELERDVTEWSTDIPAGDELDRAHASLRSLILELGRLAEAGSRDPREVSRAICRGTVRAPQRGKKRPALRRRRLRAGTPR